MRIVHVMWDFAPGTGYQTTFLPLEQRRLGHEVISLTSNLLGNSLASLRQSDDPGRKVHPLGRREEGGLTVMRIPGRFVLGRPHLGGLCGALEELQPQVIHCHAVMQYYSMAVAWYKRRHRHVRVLYDSHNQRSNIRYGVANRVGREIAARTFNLLSAKDDLYVGITPQCCQVMLELYRLPRERVYLIELGSEHRQFYPDEERRRAMRARLGLSDAHRLVLNTGKVYDSKRLDVLADAVAVARKQAPSIRLMHVGGGQPRELDGLRSAIRNAGIEDVTDLVAAVTHQELADYYRAADVCAWPGSVTTSMLDAAASGVALLVTATEGVSYQVANGNGIVCPDMAGAEEFGRALAELCNDDARRTEMGQRGRELITQRLSWERIAVRFLNLYQRTDLESDLWRG